MRGSSFFVFRMNGSSMSNGRKWSFDDGDILRCDEISAQDIQPGSKCVIKTNETYIVRQVTSIEDEVITATPLNPLYEESRISTSDILQVFVVRSCQMMEADNVIK